MPPLRIRLGDLNDIDGIPAPMGNGEIEEVLISPESVVKPMHAYGVPASAKLIGNARANATWVNRYRR